MEIFEKSGIKIPNVVLVAGATHSSPCAEVIEFLERYSDTAQKVIIDDPESELHDSFVVEFTSGSPLVRMSPLFPYSHTSDKGNKVLIKSLSVVYASKVSGLKTNTRLADLKMTAKCSGKEYIDVPQEMMAQINQSIAQLFPPVATTKADSQQSSDVPIKQSESPSRVSAPLSSAEIQGASAEQ